jgi:hypothetical protein
MAKNSKKLAIVAVDNAFETDKATIYRAFVSLVDFNWKEIGALVTKYQGDKEKLVEIKLVCAEHSIKRVFGKADYTKNASETAIAALARLDGNKPENKDALAALDETQKAARKGARNDWFSFASRIGFKMPGEARGGANNAAGSNGKLTPAPKVQPLTKEKSNVPVTVDSYVPSECADIAALRSTYISVKSLLVKLQARNASVYQGDEGSKLLAIHKNVIELLNGIKV